MPKFRMRDGTGWVKLKYVVEDVDRHGNLRVYLRIPGRRKIRLRSKPGTPEFLVEYHRAISGDFPPDHRPKRHPASKQSFRWLCERYFQSPEFAQLSPRTRYVRRRILDQFCMEHGDKPYAQMKPRHVRHFRDARSKNGPWAANNLLKALRCVSRYAVETELIERNPASQVQLISAPSDGWHTWTVEEVEQYQARHPIGTKAGLALALLLYTGLRRSDVVRLGPQHVKDGWLTLVQEKNRRRKPLTLQIPVLPELQAVIDATPCGDLAFLITQFGKPFTGNGFGNWFRKRCDEAGLQHCSAHGLRKAGATIAAENGATTNQLMAIFGWTTIKQAAHYTVKANRKVLASSGMGLLVPDQKANIDVPLRSDLANGGTESRDK